ncbi:hypothetical protein QBC39DRAFT_6672 [Podospora conica]|nr:hypothetical protein QBC39DRAFT_6672 [Schizothecium conicum]
MCKTYNITFPGCRSHKVTTLELCNDRLAERHRIASSSPTVGCCGFLFGSRSTPKERKVCTPETHWILRNEPCPTCRREGNSNKNKNKKKSNVDAAYYRPPPQAPKPQQQQRPSPPPQGFLNERQMQSMLKLQETYRAKAAAGRGRRSSSVYSSVNSDVYGGPRPVAVPVQNGYARGRVPDYLATKPLPVLPLNIKKKKPAAAPPPAPKQAPRRAPPVAPKQMPPRRPRRSTLKPMGPVRYDDEPVPDDDFIDMVYSYQR